jgi:putative transposase
MPQYQITVDEETVRGLFSGDGALAKLVEAVVNEILQGQVTEQLGATRYERTEQRAGYRNGSRPRTLIARVGTLNLRVPQVREGEFSTEVFGRYQRSEQALVLSLIEMVVNGVSTRKVAKITEELCGTSLSKSTVSELCGRLDPVVKGWNERDLSGSRYPFLLVDALVIRVREDGRVRPISAMIATGVNEQGYREILGLMLGDSESEASWGSLFAWLKQRGLHGVDVVVSDSHGGLVAAVRTHFQGCTWQRCQTHLTRNILDAAPKSVQSELHGRLRSLLEAPDPDTARTLLVRLVAEYGERASKAMAVLEDGFEDATAVLALPERYRVRLRTTNGVERLNEEIRRRERVIRIFPNRASAVRLLGALLMEIDEGWSTGHRYLVMDEYWQWRKDQEQANKANTGSRERQIA